MMNGDSIWHNVLEIDVIEVASIGSAMRASTVVCICVKRVLAKLVVSCEIGSHFGGGLETADNERRRPRISKVIYTQKSKNSSFWN